MMIDKNNPYFKQAQLLVEVLPLVAKYNCFVLKGGTAINLFVRDMPRLSVDIDLTYLPVEDRDKSLANMEGTLKQISQDIKKYIVGSSVEEISIRNPSMVSKLKIIRNEGEPDWSLLDLEGVEDLPAVRWKLFNIQKMDVVKRKDYILKLEKALQKT